MKKPHNSNSLNNPVLRYIWQWCENQAGDAIEVELKNEYSFWMTVDMPSINRQVPFLVIQDGNNLVYQFDYRPLELELDQHEKESSDGAKDGNKVEDLIETLIYYLSELDPIVNFKLKEVKGKRIIYGISFIPIDNEKMGTNISNLLLMMHHAIRVIDDADNYFDKGN